MNSRLGTFAIRASCSSFATAFPLRLVLDSFEFQQTQIFAFFPVPVGFFSDVDGRPVCNDVRSLQQPSRIEFARLSVWSKALGFRMVLVRVQKHEEILWECSTAIVLVREFVNGRLVIVDVDALRVHPLFSLG